jgi:hypothetical protein
MIAKATHDVARALGYCHITTGRYETARAQSSSPSSSLLATTSLYKPELPLHPRSCICSVSSQDDYKSGTTTSNCNGKALNHQYTTGGCGPSKHPVELAFLVALGCDFPTPIKPTFDTLLPTSSCFHLSVAEEPVARVPWR